MFSLKSVGHKILPWKDFVSSVREDHWHEDGVSQRDALDWVDELKQEKQHFGAENFKRKHDFLVVMGGDSCYESRGFEY